MSELESRVPEVKTLTFVTLREFAPKHLGTLNYEAVRTGLRQETRDLLDNAEPGRWAPEAAMAEILKMVHYGPLGGNDKAFTQFAQALAHRGISRFMRTFLSLVSARFVLKRVPVVWDRLRRNAGAVAVTTDGERVRLAYDGFPFFSAQTYRLLSLANCQALVHAATGNYPRGSVVGWSEDSLVLEFRLGSG